MDSSTNIQLLDAMNHADSTQ